MRTPRALAIVSLCLLPLLWLWPSTFGGRTFVPFDLAQYPPASLQLDDAQLARAVDGENKDVTEPPVWFVPELELAHAELAAGRLPTWNPHARGGTPLHAHGLIGLAYPVNWLALAAAEPASRLGLVAWVNLALGGLLAFGLLRALGLPLLPAWFGAVVFELSAPMAVNAFFWMRLASFVWLPGVLWGVLAVARADRWRPWPIAGLGSAFALAWLGGFPPFALTTSVLGLAFAAWLVAAAALGDGWRAARGKATRIGGGFVLGALLAMPQLLPQLRFFPQSARATPSLAINAASTFDAYGLAGYVLPDALGHPTAQAAVPYGPRNVLGLLGVRRDDDQGKPALPNFNYTEYAVFVGALGLLLAGAGALAGRGHRRGFALAALGLCAGLALFVPGVHLLFLVPGVREVPPMRWLAPATILLAWLAALGLERLLGGTRRLPLAIGAVAALLALACATVAQWPLAWHRADPTWAVARLAAKYGVTADAVVGHVDPQRTGVDFFANAFERLAAEGTHAAWWLAGAALLTAAFAVVRGPRGRSWLGVAVGVATAVQLGLHGAPVTRGVGLATSANTPVHTFLRERAAAAREHGGFTIVRASEHPMDLAALPPGQLMWPGIRDLQFYAHFDARSVQPLQRLLTGVLGADATTVMTGKGFVSQTLPDVVLPHPLLDLLGVRYVLALQPLAHAGERVGPPFAGRRGEFFVHERTTALPRAFVAPRLQRHATDEAVLDALVQPTFVPRVVVHALASDVPPAADAPPDAPDAVREVRFARNDPTHLELDVAAGQAPWLVLTDTFLPGWTAAIDGVDAPVVRVDHAFRGVHLPATACRVVLTYRAPGLAMGAALAGLAVAAWLVSYFATRRRAAGPVDAGR